MKKIIFIFFVIILTTLPNITYAEDKKADYYIWEKLNIETKLAWLGGMLGGYEQGFASGMLAELKKQGETDSKQAMFKVLQSFSIFKDDPDIYLKEMEAFYKQFPLCKKMRLSLMLIDLLGIWSYESIIKMGYYHNKTTYDEIAKQCLEAP